LDLHEDIGSQYFCGEGIPNYYVKELMENKSSRVAQVKPFPYPATLFDLKLNSTRLAQVKGNAHYCAAELNKAGFHGAFGLWTATQQVGAIWHTLYFDDESDLQAGFVRVWEAIAKYFGQKENHSPYILGYELLNEPSAMCLHECENGGVSKQSDQAKIMQMYEKAAKAIRKWVKTGLIFFEIGMDSNTYGKERHLWRTFDHTPVSKADPNSVVAYHVYQCGVDQLGDGSGCYDVQKEYMQHNIKYSSNIGAASFITEFGSLGEHQQDQEASVAELTSAANELLQSWSYWEYAYWRGQPTSNTDEGMFNISAHTVDMTKFWMLTHPYCRAVQGTHLGMRWDRGSNILHCAIKMDPAIKAPTEVFLGPWLPKRVEVTTYPPSSVTAVRKGSFLQLYSTLQEVQGVDVHIHVSSESEEPQDVVKQALSHGEAQSPAQSTVEALSTE
jgi:hypothetical protein